MNSLDILEYTIKLGGVVTDSYLADLSDDEMMKRPTPGCNHLKWQMGHLIAAEHNMVEQAAPGSMPPLPDGFAARYSKEQCGCDDPAAFDSKEELMRVYDQQRAATLAALKLQNDESLGKPAPEAVASYAPTIGAVFAMQGGHWLMHAGQWAVVRRQLGRPPIF